MRATKNWPEKVSDNEAHRRAAGRRRHNAGRQEIARRRLEIVLNLRWHNPELSQADIARRMNVDRATICRDLKVVRIFGRSPGPYRYNFIAEFRPDRALPWRVWKPTD